MLIFCFKEQGKDRLFLHLAGKIIYCIFKTKICLCKTMKIKTIKQNNPTFRPENGCTFTSHISLGYAQEAHLLYKTFTLRCAIVAPISTGSMHRFAVKKLPSLFKIWQYTF